jgi:hypothetical protein
MNGTPAETTVVLSAYEARLVAAIVGNALEQDHDEIAGDYFWFLLDDDVMDLYNSDSDDYVEEARENFQRIRETLASVQEKTTAASRQKEE